MAKNSLHHQAYPPRRSHGRVTALVMLSSLVHLGAFGAAVTAWRLGQSSEPVPSRLVLVDLASPTADSGQALPPEPARETVDARVPLDQRVAKLTADNAALAARVRDQDEQKAQIEAEHRASLAARDTALSELGDELGAVVADRDALSSELAAARERAASLQQELDARQRAELLARSELASTYDQLVSSLRAEIDAKDIALERANARVTVAVVDRVLFPTGQAQLTSDGERVIDKIGAALAAVPNRRILIEGHTDDVPIGAELRTRFPSNWELSTARATTVVKRLIEHGGIVPNRLQASGRADTDPAAANDTDEGRRLNRRIEIIVLPPDTGFDSGPTS